MNTSQPALPGRLLAQMAPLARRRFASDTAWAAASGLPKETLSRLRKNLSCDLRTLDALARSAECSLVAVPRIPAEVGHWPSAWSREFEDALLNLCASGDTDASTWSALGPAWFMGGLAVLLAGTRGFDRSRYLRLAELLHPGVSTPEVFGAWLTGSPLKPARFLPMLRRRRTSR